MTDAEFKQIEGRLYNHYRQLSEIEKLKYKIEILKNQIVDIESDIKYINVNVDPTLNMSIDFGERVQTSPSGTGYAESEIIRQIGRLEKELNQKKDKLLKLKGRMRLLQEVTADLSFNIAMQNEEFKCFVKHKYKDCKSIRWIARETYQDVVSTARNRRISIIEDIGTWCKTLEKIHDKENKQKKQGIIAKLNAK